MLLTRAIPVPEPGDIPRHERFYYLELLRRAGMMERFPDAEPIELDGIAAAREAGAAKLAELGVHAARRSALVPAPHMETPSAGCRRDSPRLQQVWRANEARKCWSSAHPPSAYYASKLRKRFPVRVTSPAKPRLREFIDLAAACSLFLTNDSGAMHIAYALGVPVTAVFGATDDATTGPSGRYSRVIREHAECSPCLLRDCPIDHRCMTRVTTDRVSAAALDLWPLRP